MFKCISFHALNACVALTTTSHLPTDVCTGNEYFRSCSMSFLQNAASAMYTATWMLSNLTKSHFNDQTCQKQTLCQKKTPARLDSKHWSAEVALHQSTFSLESGWSIKIRKFKICSALCLRHCLICLWYWHNAPFNTACLNKNLSVVQTQVSLSSYPVGINQNWSAQGYPPRPIWWPQNISHAATGNWAQAALVRDQSTDHSASQRVKNYRLWMPGSTNSFEQH